MIFRFALLSIVFLGIVTLAGVLYVARPVIVPVAAAFVVGLMVAPMGERAQRLGAPLAITNLVVLANIASVVVLAYVFLAPKLELFFADLPMLLQKLAAQFEQLLRPLENLQSALAPKGGGKAVAEGQTLSIDAGAIAMYVVTAGSPALTQIFIFAFALVMFLIDRPLMKKAIVLGFNTRESRLEALKFVNQVEASLSRYLSTVFVINLGVGAATTVALFLAGMPGYFALGAVAFLLNFMPFVGPLLLKGGLLLLGLAAFPTVLQGLVPTLLYTAIILVESNLVTPFLVGRKFSMPPLLVFISIVFWTWLWGVTGALLATPLLVIGSTIVDRFLTEDKLVLPG